jgi:hypothetical protein
MKPGRSILFVAALLSCPLPAHAERLWLVITASDPTPAGIAEKAKRAGRQEGMIIRTSDCGDRKNVYALAAGVEATQKAAEATANKVRNSAAKDAFVKTCEVKRGSLLAFRIPAVDPSIAGVPDTAVNWEDEDRVSTVKALPDGRSVAIVRFFEPANDDPLEGRRERVLLVDKSGKQRQLEEQCPSAAHFWSKAGLLAFHCVTEQAGDHLMHRVLLFDDEGRKLKEISRCRNPRLAAGGYLCCKAESVGADGMLRLRTVEHPTLR